MSNEAATRERLTEARRRALARVLAEERPSSGEAPDRIGPRAPGVAAPLSFAQEIIWLFERAHPGSCAYNSAQTLRVDGPFDVSAFGAAVTGLAHRHEALRTIVDASDEQPRQHVLPPTNVPVAVHDFRDLPSADREPAAFAALRTIAETPFSLTAEPPLRVAVARTGDDAWLLLLLTHHIVSDAWSYAIMFRELAALYEAELAGVTASLPPVERGFGDFAAWQRAALRGDRLERGRAYWRDCLAGAPVLDLAADRPRPLSSTFAGARCEYVVPGTLLTALRAVSERTGATLYAILLAAFASLLQRYSGQDDIIVGSAVAGRTHSETESIVGYFSQALPMRVRFDGDPSFETLLRRVRDGILGAIEHQEVPFETLVQAAAGANRTAAPLFRAVLTMQDPSAIPRRLGAATTQLVDLDIGTTKFDLTLLATEHADRLALSLWYSTELFVEATAARLLGHFGRLLESIADDPTKPVASLELLTAAERVQLEGWNTAPGGAVALEPVDTQIARAARRTPDAVALVCRERRLTYRALDAAVEALARRLRLAGVGRGTLVGLALEPSSAAIITLLAVLRARGAYVPLAADGPRARRERQIVSARLRFVMTSAGLADELAGAGRVILCVDGEGAVCELSGAAGDAALREFAGGATLELTGPAGGAASRELAGADSDTASGAGPGVAGLDSPSAGLDDLAYIIFTSGSTGEPKGVAITQRNLAHYTAAITERLSLGAEPLRYATVSSLAADLGHTAIFPALCSGGALHVIPPQIATDPVRFAAMLAAEPIDLLKITPSHFRALWGAGLPAAVLPRQWLVLGGERCPWPLLEEIRPVASCRVLNHYGPTEATVGACTFLAGERELGDSVTASVPIGLPLANVRAYVLDAGARQVPVGVPGELHIGGPGVAAGYLYRADLTAERFVTDPFSREPGARMYRSGDRVRRLPTGDLEFLGRLDLQVKIRGYRVELGEIEAAISANPAVAQAAVVLSQLGAEDARIVAYVVLQPDCGPAADAGELVLPALTERLPDYMLPSAVVALERLPLTANGKLDRASLPDPKLPQVVPGVAPRSATEAAIAALWAEVLGQEAVGIHDDFLALGGHSILAIRLLGKLSRRFGVKLSLRSLFEAATVARLTEIVDRAAAQASGA